MARQVSLYGEWTLRGRAGWASGAVVGPVAAPVPGSVEDALELAGVLADTVGPEADRAREWVSRRVWEFERLVALPEEPHEGRSEKVYLCLRVAGRGVVRWNGTVVGQFDGPWELCRLDITRHALESGPHRLRITIESPPDGEDGVPRAAILEAYVHMVAFARIERLLPQPQGNAVFISLHVEGATSGRVLCKYRLLLGDELIASEDIQEKLIADRQSYTHTLEVPNPQTWHAGQDNTRALYTLRLTLERGGTRCDSVTVSFAFRNGVFVPMAGSALPYAYIEEGRPLFLRGVNLLAPVSEEELQACARSGVNLVRFTGPLPPDEATLLLCDLLGLLVWQEVPETPAAAYDAALVLTAHPAGAVLSAGSGLCGPDDRPLTPAHPLAHAFREAALSVHRGLHILPSSPSGPVAYVREEEFGAGLCHDVHGPLTLREGAFEEMDACDAVLLSKLGFPAPQSWRFPEANWKEQYTPSYVADWEERFGPAGEMGRDEFLRLGAFLQERYLRYALLAARRREGEGCAGTIVWCAHMPWCAPVPHVLTDAHGHERPAWGALATAYAPYALSAKFSAEAPQRGEATEAEVFFHIPQGTETLATVDAQVVDLRGNIVSEESWLVNAVRVAQPAGTLRFSTDADTPEVLLLRLKAQVAGTTVAQDCWVLPIAQAGEAPYAPLRRLPKAQASLARRLDGIELCNDSAHALVGLTVYAGTRLLLYGTLPPWERRSLHLPEGALPETLRIEALNLLE